MLTVASQVKDFDKESWHQAWNGMARKATEATDRDAAGRVLAALVAATEARLVRVRNRAYEAVWREQERPRRKRAA